MNLLCKLGLHSWKVYENTQGIPSYGHVTWPFTVSTGAIICRRCGEHKINYVCRIDYTEPGFNSKKVPKPMTPTDEQLERWTAEKVMGWESHDGASWNIPGSLVWRLPLENWHPTRDLNQTFMVMEKMREKGWRFHLWIDEDAPCEARFICERQPEIDKKGEIVFPIGEVASAVVS